MSKNLLDDDIEYFDVVNEHDEVIDRLPRDEVHAKGLLHRAVHGLIMTSDGVRFLLQKRADDKQHEPGCWDTSVSGHVSSGETYDEAMIRETAEEMGIQLKEPAIKLFKLGMFDGVDDEFVWVYLIINDDEITPCKREVADTAWFSADELIDFVQNEKEQCSMTLKSIVQKMLQHDMQSSHLPVDNISNDETSLSNPKINSILATVFNNAQKH